jgi:hypothetical protein
LGRLSRSKAKNNVHSSLVDCLIFFLRKIFE